MQTLIKKIKKLSAPLNKRGLILMYHRVAKLSCDPWQLAVSPEYFEQQMEVLGKYGRLVKVREMGRYSNRFNFGPKEISVSFDDGYADNYHHAKPILEKYGIPATFFIVSSSINSHEEFWWDALEQIILASRCLPETFNLSIQGVLYHWMITQEDCANMIEYDGMIESLPPNGKNLSKIELYGALWQILSKVSFNERKPILQLIADWAQSSLSVRPNYCPMTSKELNMLASHKLFEIGAHTAHHPMLSHLSTEEQKKEIEESKRNLEEHINTPVITFSYPYGCYSKETPDIIKELKFQNACTTMEGFVTRSGNSYLMPRMNVLNWSGDEFEKHLIKWFSSN